MIYLLEDDETIRELVAYTLSNTLMETKSFSCAADLRKAMAQELPALFLLDIMLPGEDGMSVLHSLRERPETARIPVMMLTAKSAEYDKVLGLDSGADDYLTKPFGMMELISRVRALLRRAGTAETQTPQLLRCGTLCMDLSAHRLTVAGEEIILTRKEYDLLRLFLENRGRAFTRDQLLNRIWGYDFDGESRTVDVHIRSLRQKLGADGERISTVRGIGYRLEEEV